MNANSCPHEATVSRSARTGCWDDATRAHVKGCSYCGEIAQTAAWMGDVAGIEERENSLPDPEQVWLNARMLAIQESQERALLPLAIAELVVKAVLFLVLAAGIVWSWFGIQSLAVNSIPPYLRVPQPIIVSATALATCLVALVFIKLTQPILIEE